MKTNNLLIYTSLCFLLISCVDTYNSSSNNESEIPSDTSEYLDSSVSDTSSVLSGPSSSTSESIKIPEIVVNEVTGFNEMISVSFEKEEEISYTISYKQSSDTNFIEVDKELIQENDNTIKSEIIGITKGVYDVKITASYQNEAIEEIIEDIEVSQIDRSGYANFNINEGIGAYNNDGTIKDNAIVLYLTNENKNTLEATFSNKKYIGIVDILSNLDKSTAPVLIRVKGKITTNQFEYKEVIPRLADDSNLSSTHFENTFSNEYGENIVGLPISIYDKKEGLAYQYKTTKTGLEKINDKASSKATTTYTRNKYPEIQGKTVYHDDTSFNDVPIKNAKYLTIEGLFDDAEIFQWGFSFSNTSSIEIRNLTFTDYPEDAIGISSNSNSCGTYSRFFIHNNKFNRGKNNWDLTGEQDKYAGDGAIDINNVANVTVSYNEFNECNKTGLVGSGDSSCSKNITFHHNYYKKISSRLPLARKSNIHIYNNYYDQCSSCLQIRTGAYVFSEENYFSNSQKCHNITDATIKSYNDIFSSSTGINSVSVSSREQIVKNDCVIENEDYTKFDIDENLFYYDKENKVSDVSVLNKAKDVKIFLDKHCGVKGKYNQLPLTKNETLNEQINSSFTNNSLVLDVSNITSSTTIDDNSYILAGDFKIYYGFDFTESSNGIILKNLGSNFKTKEGTIEFISPYDGDLNIEFASRNTTATDRYIIIYDENGNELYRSECANGNQRSTFTFKISKDKKYFIGSNKGLSFYSIY